MTDTEVDEFAQIFSASPHPCDTLDQLRMPDGQWKVIAVENATTVEEYSGKGVTMAIIDTGIALGHPQLEPNVIERVDLTGQGEGDECGHGTLMALLLLSTVPEANIIDVKALGRDGKTRPQTLIDALHWITSRGNVIVVNMSAGVYRPWCAGDCDLCSAANEAVEAGIMVAAAVGNREGITSCPAKAQRVMQSTVVDEAGQLLPNTGLVGPNGLAASQPIVRADPPKHFEP